MLQGLLEKTGLSGASEAHRMQIVNRERADAEKRRIAAKLVWTDGFSHGLHVMMTEHAGSRIIANDEHLNYPQFPNRNSSTERNPIISVFLNTCMRWRLDKENQLILLGYRADDRAGSRMLASRLNRLPRDVEDRAGYVIGISLGLSVLFGDEIEAEMSWLNEPRTKLNGNSAIDYMLEGGIVNLFVVSEMVKRERAV